MVRYYRRVKRANYLVVAYAYEQMSINRYTEEQRIRNLAADAEDPRWACI
jgi:hypothetical protein